MTRVFAGQAPQENEPLHEASIRTARRHGDGTPIRAPADSRAALCVNPALVALEKLRSQGNLRRKEVAVVDHIAQAATLREDVLTNGELLRLQGKDDSSIAPAALRRSASFTRCQPILDDLKPLLQALGSGAALDEIDRCLVEAGLHEVRHVSKTVQSDAIKQARAGARIAPLTTTRHQFRWFLERHQRLLTRIVSACSLSGEPRHTALQDGLTELAHAYCNAANILAPTGNLKVILSPDGQDHVVVSGLQRNGTRDFRIVLTTEGVDHPGVDPLAALQRRGLASRLTGFERKSTPTRQGVSYLQCFFHEMTVFEEYAKTIAHSPGPMPPLSRRATKSHEELTYEGDPVLGDTLAERTNALAPVRELAAAMAVGIAEPVHAAVMIDPQLRAWLESPGCDRDLTALISPAVRIPIAQEPVARAASAPTLMFHA